MNAMTITRSDWNSLISKLAQLESDIRTLSNSTRLRFSSIEDGAIAEYDADGNLVGIIGKQPDGSHLYATVDGPDPLQPTAPTVIPKALSATIIWDGNFIDPVSGVVDAELPAYADTEGIEVHFSQNSADPPSSATYAGEFVNVLGGSIEIPAPAGVGYVTMRVRSKAKKYGPVSTTIQTTIPQLVDFTEYQGMFAQLEDAKLDIIAAQAQINEALDGPVDVDRLVIGTGIIHEAVIGALAADLANIIEANIANLYVTEGAVINTLVAQTLAAQTAEFLEIAANQITGGEITALLKLVAGGELLVGNESTVHVRIMDGKVVVFSPRTSNPDGSTNEPIAQMVMGGTTGGSFEAFDVATGSPLGGTRSDGTMYTPRIDAGEIYLDGELLETKLSEMGPHILARGLLGVSHSEYTGDTLLAGLKSPEPMLPGREYQLKVQFRARVNTPTTYIAVNVHFTTNGTAPTLASPVVVGTKYFGQSQASTLIGTQEFTFNFDTSGQTWLKPRFVMSLDAAVGTGTSRDYRFALSDEGTMGINTMYDAYNPPPASSFARTTTIASKTTYTQYGENTSYSPALVRHGTGGSSYYRSYLLVPSAALSDIRDSISTPTVKLWLYFATDNPDVVPYIGTASSGADGTISNQVQLPFAISGTSRDGLRKGEGGWITLTSSQVAALRSSSNYIVVGRKTSAPLVTYYGPSASSSTARPKVRVYGTE